MTIASNAGLAPALIERSAQWYDEHRIPSGLQGAPATLLKRAFRLAGRDWRRIYLDTDGTLVITNQPCWTPE